MEQSLLRVYKVMAHVQSIIANSATIDVALRDGMRAIADEMDAEAAVLWYAEDDELRPYFWKGPIDITSERRKRGEGIVGQVFETQKAVRMLDYAPGGDEYIERYLEDKVKITSMLAVPFSSMTENLGVLQVVNKHGGTFTDEEADVIEMFSMLAAIALTEKESLAKPKDFGEPILTVRGITRDYVNGDVVTHVLKGINLDVHEGEFLVLLGESGCGKSTLMNIMAGLDAPTDGSVEFMGKQIVGASQDELTEYRRANIGFIFQSYNLMPNLNARQNLDLIGELVDDPMSASEALGLVGLADRVVRIRNGRINEITVNRTRASAMDLVW